MTYTDRFSGAEDLIKWAARKFYVPKVECVWELYAGLTKNEAPPCWKDDCENVRTYRITWRCGSDSSSVMSCEEHLKEATNPDHLFKMHEMFLDTCAMEHHRIMEAKRPPVGPTYC